MDTNNRKLRIKDEYLKRALAQEEFLLFDGAMGTMRQMRGLDNLEKLPDLLSVTYPAEIEAIHRAYVEAGSQVITTNTFGANRLKLGSSISVEEVYVAAAECARKAGARYIAGDIGPTGALLEPMGTLSFDEAYDIFKEQALAAKVAGCDIIAIETFADLREAKAAVLAAVENTDLPVFVTMTFGEDGRTFLGTTPLIAAALLSRLGVSAMGVNCSLGPAQLAEIVTKIARTSKVPMIAQPNAGMPQIVDGQTIYNMTPADFANAMIPLIDSGANIIGGCCGTTPEFIAAIAHTLEGRTPIVPVREDAFIVASAQEALVIPSNAHHIDIIGERINPTGNKRLAAALRAGEYDYVVNEALEQTRAGARVLDVNVGLPDMDEVQALTEVVELLSSTLTTPLQIDSSDSHAIEAAVRSYPGRPLINSVNGKQDSLETILPIAKKYGCAVLGLTLDEDGIPSDAEARYEIAKRIVERAKSYGISKEDIAIDCLVMTVATNQSEVACVLDTLKLVKKHLGVKTVLGVSNISFGMPHREIINATFLAAAFGAGLDMPILNPLTPAYRQCVDVLSVLSGQDTGSVDYIEKYSALPSDVKLSGTDHVESSAMTNARSQKQKIPFEAPSAFADNVDTANSAIEGVLSGRANMVSDAVKQLVNTHTVIDIIDGLLIPSLDEIGMRYDRGDYFLPQLMSSAEAAKAGFDVIRAHAAENPDSLASVADDDVKATSPVVLATVEGDIHDIGKNIVAMLLENYGYNIIDLGRDVSSEKIIEALRESRSKLLGLSALMTTTVSAMEQTIKDVHAELPDVKIMVGGAVLTPEYAREINADYYAKDATASARIAAECCILSSDVLKRTSE